MSTLSRRRFLKAAGAGAAALALPGVARVARAERRRPNILLIMADDMGFSDVGCYGGEIETPNIDSLAEGGVRFTQGYNNAKCAPTRASLLTGLYAQQTGCHGGPVEMRDCVTVAEALKAAGYRTLMTGKWHASQIPVERGFDRHFGLADGCCNYWNPGLDRPGERTPGRKTKNERRRWAIDGKEFRPYTPEARDFYTTDAFSDCAVKYLDEYGGEGRPFFMYVAYTAPHYPLHAWPEDIAKYRGRYRAGWDAVRSARYARQVKMGLIDPRWRMSSRDPGVPGWAGSADKDAWDLRMAVYAAMIDRMDQGIGRVLGKIRELGEEENTLVMFLSDNGGCAEQVNRTPDIPPGPVESYRSVDPAWANASNTPFRKYKSWDHEGGVCTPLIARWSGVIRPRSITHEVAHVIDFMATFVDVAGAKYPSSHEGRKVKPLEGKSLLPVLEGRRREGHEALYWQYGSSCAVRKGRWKIVSGQKGPWELYDLEADRTELVDLAGEHGDVVKDLSATYEAWATRVGARPWRPKATG